MQQFELLRSYLDSKFNQQKEELNKEMLCLQQRQQQTIKISAKPEINKTLKYKGNQYQHDFKTKLAQLD